MTTADWDSFELDGEEIEVVTSFSFLGSEVEKERCDKRNKTKGGDRKSYNDWTRKDMVKQTREHRNEKKG